MSTSPHLTTRRGFVAALGFGGISLYGLWVGYGAAPGPVALLRPAGAAEDHLANAASGAGSHGAMAAGLDEDAFRSEVADFVTRFLQADGSVYPQRDQTAAMDMEMPAMTSPTHASGPDMDHDQHGAQAVEPAVMAPGDHAAPISVPMLAERWFYEPAHLRLDAGTPYRFRLLAADIPHGASVQFGRGARMIRLRPGSVTELDLTFTQPGSYLVYCTAYCGTGHDAMQARVDVV